MRWVSGLNQQFAKLPYGFPYRGFESPFHRTGLQFAALRQAVVVFMPRQACLSGSIKQQASPDGESCYPVQGPARQGIGDVGAERRNPSWAQPGEGVGECTARRASTIPRVTAGCQNCPPRNHSRESHKNKRQPFFPVAFSVGVLRLERRTLCSQSRYANQLRHTPNSSADNKRFSYGRGCKGMSIFYICKRFIL